MPTPRHHGGAPLIHIPLNVPAFNGLNRQASSSLLGVEWATRLEETVIDENGRIASRKGWELLTTTTPATEAFVRMTEYRTRAGARELIATSATKVWKSTNNGDTWSDVTGTATFTDGNWQFFNFNDKLVGLQKGKKPIVYSGTTFAHVADVNAPEGGVGVAAYGRLWVMDSDGTTLRYSALLDETDWTSSDSGNLDLFNTWPGADQCVALAAFNSAIFAFGKENIVVFTDGSGSVLGLDPLNAYVVDNFAGVGCIARDSIKQVDGDLWFLSSTGLQSLGRLITEKSNPLQNLSVNVQDYLRDVVAAATDIEAVFSPQDRFYLLSCKTGGTSGTTFVFDTRGPLEDMSARCAGVWLTQVPRAMCIKEDNSFLFSIPSETGKIGRYRGQTSPAGPWVMRYESGWLDFDSGGHLKFLKRFGGVFFMDRTAQVNFVWAWDFEDNFVGQSVNFATAGGTTSGWGESEWGSAEWAGGTALRDARVPGYSSGEYLKIGITATIDNTKFAIQQAELFAKIGRLA